MDSQQIKVRVLSSLYSLYALIVVALIGSGIAFLTSTDFMAWIAETFKEWPLLVTLSGLFVQQLVLALRNILITRKLGRRGYAGSDTIKENVILI